MIPWQLAVALAASTLLAILAALMALVKLRRLRRSRLFQSDPSGRARSELAEMMRQIDRFSGQVDERLQSRLRELHELCEEADEKARRLRRLTDAGADGGAYMPTGKKQQEILRLGRQGLTATEIAQRTKTGIGEVELVLHLQGVLPASRQ